MIMSLIIDSEWSCTDVLRLRSVSVRWKNVADRCSKLWHKLSIEPPGSRNRWASSSNAIRSFDLVKKYLQLSNLVLLDVTIHLIASIWSQDQVAEQAAVVVIRNMLLELLKHSQRWIAFELLIVSDGVAGTEIDHLFDLFWQTGALPAANKLETLAICHSKVPHFSSHDRFQNTCSRSTLEADGSFRLQHLRCDTSLQSFPPEMLQHITVLSITHWRSDTVTLAVLAHTPCLMDLTVRSLISTNISLPVRHLPHLKAICLIDASSPDAAMACFSAPAVETIRVLSATHGRAVLSYRSFELLVGSRDALSVIKTLDISGARVANIDLQRVLTGCMAATDITFRAMSIDHVRTPIFKHIRESIRDRLGFAGVEEMKVTVVGWMGSRTNPSAVMEWDKLKRLSISSSVAGEFVFTSFHSRS